MSTSTFSATRSLIPRTIGAFAVFAVTLVILALAGHRAILAATAVIALLGTLAGMCLVGTYICIVIGLSNHQHCDCKNENNDPYDLFHAHFTPPYSLSFMFTARELQSPCPEVTWDAPPKPNQSLARKLALHAE